MVLNIVMVSNYEEIEEFDNMLATLEGWQREQEKQNRPAKKYTVTNGYFNEEEVFHAIELVREDSPIQPVIQITIVRDGAMEFITACGIEALEFVENKFCHDGYSRSLAEG